jgi:hypothetical protein
MSSGLFKFRSRDPLSEKGCGNGEGLEISDFRFMIVKNSYQLLDTTIKYLFVGGNMDENGEKVKKRVRLGIPDSIFNLYIDTTDGKPYYHSKPMNPDDPMVIRGVSVELVWKLGFDLVRILAFYRKKRPGRICCEVGGVFCPQLLMPQPIEIKTCQVL